MDKIKQKIKKGQEWEDKNTGRVFVITGKASGNGHWYGLNGKQSHHIHEGTLRKFYKLGGE